MSEHKEMKWQTVLPRRWQWKTWEIVYYKILRETIITERKKNRLTKWQEWWTSSTKGAVSKLVFPSIKERMKTKIPISAKFTAMVTGHSLTRSYLHCFKIIPNSTFPCRLQEEQTINHIILNLDMCYSMQLLVYQ
jgi:hypothetical protein